MILDINKPLADFDKANRLTSLNSNRLVEIREVLGEDLCIWYLKNYKGLGNLLNSLEAYSDSYEKSQKSKETFNQLLEAVNPHNYDARIIPLMYAYGTGNETNRLLKLFERAKADCVWGLLQLSTWTIDEKENAELIKFIKWLSEDRLARLINDLHSLFKKVRDEEIIKTRAQGATLEETSTYYGLTHEGVRLIEKKLQVRFDRYISRTIPHYILYAFSKNTCYISMNEIDKLLRNLSDIFAYFLKLSTCTTAHWSDQLNGFIIGDGKWYERFIEYKIGLPEILYCELVDEIISELIGDLSLPISFDDARRLVLADYSLSGKVYLKKRMSLSKMYYTVLQKYYPDGIKLYDNSEAICFRNYVRALFGNVYLPENNRAIDVRLVDLTILCDRGKRILPSGVKISEELLKEIHDAIIEFGRNEIMFIEIFEKFKKELLENSNIGNKYFLQGVLKQNYSHEFYFARYSCKIKP